MVIINESLILILFTFLHLYICVLKSFYISKDSGSKNTYPLPYPYSSNTVNHHNDLNSPSSTYLGPELGTYQNWDDKKKTTYVTNKRRTERKKERNFYQISE